LRGFAKSFTEEFAVHQTKDVAGSNGELTDEELKLCEKTELERYRIKDRPFPKPMAEEAFYGLAGDVVRIIEPHSEASREAILAQFLVALGNDLGRGPHRKQAGIHHLNEFAVLVGETSMGRKGTSWEAVKNLLTESEKRERDGMQSGEAVIHCVRDAIYGVVPLKKRKTGQADKAETTLLDAGVDDKRLLIVEEEFARLLNVAGRPGNTLSSVLRKGWDGKACLYVEGKISPSKATGAHISMIGHVTAAELLACISEVENKNGFSNRVLWVAVQRTKELPIPLWINWHKHPDIKNRVAEVMKTLGPKSIERGFEWDAQAEKEWSEFYKSKSKLIAANSSGIVGSIVARSHAHVLRLTMLYTVLDNSTLMKPEHLRAAIAFWQYCERSAMWVFGQKTGNKMADKIDWALKREPKGMTRSQINLDVFNNHAGKVSLDQAFSLLIDASLARFVMERAKGKVATERWFSTGEHV
jgi:hypothetical protein